jgi:ABC-2 type transport system ATP-binding protein
MNALDIQNAHKSFGAVQALDGASLELRQGELLALLGPNGAGKTTLVRTLAGRVRLDRGEVRILGQAVGPGDARPNLGVVPQELALYPLLNARENLEVFAALHGVPRAARAERARWALEWTALGDRASVPVKTFSGGMKRRLNIACGVLHQPQVVLLDEPTVGVDPQSRERIYDMLAGLRQRGASLLLTTHHLEEAEARCERIVIIDHGRVAASGTPRDLIAATIGGGRVLRLALERPIERVPEGFELDGERGLRALVADVPAELPALLARVQAAGGVIQDLEVRGPSLQEAFIRLTGRDLRE